MIELSAHTEEKIRHAKLLVVGGSAGSFTLIQELVNALSEDFPMPVVLVLHRGRQYKSILDHLLQQYAAVTIKEAGDKEILKPAHVYIAPADYHLLVEENDTLSLDISDPVWYCRPSVDVLFESAAESYGQNMIAVLFSGANEDGADGMALIHRRGGCTMAQDPEDAEFRTMPEAAIRKNAVDLVFKAADIYFIIKEIQRLNNYVRK